MKNVKPMLLIIGDELIPELFQMKDIYHQFRFLSNVGNQEFTDKSFKSNKIPKDERIIALFAIIFKFVSENDITDIVIPSKTWDPIDSVYLGRGFLSSKVRLPVIVHVVSVKDIFFNESTLLVPFLEFNRIFAPTFIHSSVSEIILGSAKKIIENSDGSLLNCIPLKRNYPKESEESFKKLKTLQNVEMDIDEKRFLTNEKIQESYLICSPAIPEPDLTFPFGTLGSIIVKSPRHKPDFHGRIYGLNQ